MSVQDVLVIFILVILILFLLGGIRSTGAQEAPLEPGWNLVAGTNSSPDTYKATHPECDVMNVWAWNPVYRDPDPSFASGWRWWNSEVPQELQQIPMMMAHKGYWVYCDYKADSEAV